MEGPLFRYRYLALDRDVFTKYSLLAQKKFAGKSITGVSDNQRNLKRTMFGARVEYLKVNNLAASEIPNGFVF